MLGCLWGFKFAVNFDFFRRWEMHFKCVAIFFNFVKLYLRQMKMNQYVIFQYRLDEVAMDIYKIRIMKYLINNNIEYHHDIQ